MKELAERANRKGICTFSDFLNLQEQKIALEASNEVVLWGGTNVAERKIACFGANALQNFPISVLKIEIVGGKFASEITHRDVLGALMGLQIAREKIGDLFVGEDCYAVLHESVASFVVQNLNSVGRNTVKVQFADNVPKEYYPKKRRKNSCRFVKQAGCRFKQSF